MGLSCRAAGWISVNDDLSHVCRQAQRVEQARQELISQVTESAAKTLETIRGLSLSLSVCLSLAGSSIIVTYSSRCIRFFSTGLVVFSPARIKRQRGMFCDSRLRTRLAQHVYIKYKIGISAGPDLQSCFVCGCDPQQHQTKDQHSGRRVAFFRHGPSVTLRAFADARCHGVTTKDGGMQ